MIPEYQDSYYKIIDDFFTPQECQDLISLAESDAEWIQAAVHYGLGSTENYVNTDYRNSERILRFDSITATKLFEKLLLHIQDIKELKPGEGFAPPILGPGINPTYKLVGLNERLSFLRYGSGHYFRGHCDGHIQLPDGRRSFVTVQIYLGKDDVEGGATRFWSSNGKEYYDVEPKLGRVLIFQQRNLTHSGEDVVRGTKYALRSDLMFMKA